MLLTLSLAGEDDLDARDLGFLLHKHPDRVQRFPTGAGVQAVVLYPEATPQRCTVALLLEVDPVERVQQGRGTPSSAAAYVDATPYTASSLLAVALAKVFRTALAGRLDSRPDLPGRLLDLSVHVPAAPGRAGDVHAFFGPLGWVVDARPLPLDPEVPAWGDARLCDVRLTGRLRLADALSHLYVLLPVLEDAKHYRVAQDEVDKLLRAAGSWLPAHPQAEQVTRRYLRHRRRLVASAVERLAEVDDTVPEALDDAVPPDAEEAADSPETPRSTLGDAARPVPLARQRSEAVLGVLRDVGATRVLDLGCGEGRLLLGLLADPRVREVVGVDVSARALRITARRLRLDSLHERQRERVRLLQSSLTYRDARLAGYDAAALVEVVEHLDPERLPALERALLGHARPGTVVVTTPNAEHNVRYGLAPGAPRHPDHRFEWTREEFRRWARAAGERWGYDARFGGVGEDDPEVGPPTSLAVLTRRDAAPFAAVDAGREVAA